VQRRERGLVPYLSSDEHNYFSGSPAEFQAGNISGRPFLSNRSLSGGTVDSNDLVSAFYTAGYFRTDAEGKKSDDVKRTIAWDRSAYRFDGTGWLDFCIPDSIFEIAKASRQPEIPRRRLLARGLRIQSRIIIDRLFGEWVCSNRTIGGVSGIVFQSTSSGQVFGQVVRQVFGQVDGQVVGRVAGQVVRCAVCQRYCIPPV